MNQLVSICIPTANLGKYSLPYLRQCLNSIGQQDYSNIEVVVSDHSKDDIILSAFIEEFSPSLNVPMSYHRFIIEHGSAVANLNNAIKLSSGELIKPLFQDDYLSSPHAISQMVQSLNESGKGWCGTGCRHVDEEDKDLHYLHPPGWVPTLEMAYGLNLLGSPSVMMWQKDLTVMMDPQLRFLNDCEFYYRYGQKYGAPALVNQILVTIRMRKEGISAEADIGETKNREHKYLDVKYPH